MVRIAVCDDNKDFAEIFSTKISKTVTDMGLKCDIITFQTLQELQSFDSGRIDILFLDVMLSEGNSLDWLTENSLCHKPQIIAMTAFPQEVYNLSRTDTCFLLLKSHIDNKTLACALQKALQKISEKVNTIIVGMGSKSHAIATDDIVFIESFNNNILLHLVDGEINLYTTLKDFGKSLPFNFLKCHKSYIINMNHVTGFYRNFFTMKNGKTVPIPPKKYNSVIKEYSDYIKMI